MARELRYERISYTVRKMDDLPIGADGEHMDADDVAAEIREVLHTALGDWYAARGKDLLALPPDC